jgi:starch synthase
MHGGPARLLATHAAGLDLLVLDAPHLYARPGNPYLGPDGAPWADNALRFAALAQCAASIARGAVPGFAADVVQAHDWQAGLVPALLHYAGGPRPGTVMTVHNLAFQGQFPPELLASIGLPPHAYGIDGVEYYGTIGYLKAGLALADRITTVSPTYAAEIRTPAGGMGLDGLLRHRADVLTGILNGIDDALWNPETDVHSFNASTPAT